MVREPRRREVAAFPVRGSLFIDGLHRSALPRVFESWLFVLATL
jgi:hypothetical protein